MTPNTQTQDRVPSSAMSRRGFLGAVGATGAAAASRRAALADPPPATPMAVTAAGGDSKTITWANWTCTWTTTRSRAHPTLKEFEEETGYTVKYREDIDDNVTFNARSPAVGQRPEHRLRPGHTDRLAGRRGGSPRTSSRINDANVPNKTNILPPWSMWTSTRGANTL